MKILFGTIAATLAATSTMAGSLAYVAPAAPMMIEETPAMGGSGAWLIPLLAIALICLAINKNPQVVNGQYPGGA